jgi:hypothetical protein
MTEVLNLDAIEKTDEPVEMVDLFQLNGRMYQIAKKPKVNVALKFLKLIREKNELEAAAMMLPEMIGDEAFGALADYDDLTPEILNQVAMAAAKVTMGGLEKALGNSNSGPRK